MFEMITRESKAKLPEMTTEEKLLELAKLWEGMGKLIKEIIEVTDHHLCKGCGDEIYTNSYCTRCNRLWES